VDVALALDVLALLVGAGALGIVLAGVAQAARSARVPPLALGPRPSASVIVPCKGHHPGLAENLVALATQDYDDYEVLVVVDDVQDPCAAVAQGVAMDHPKVRVVLTDPVAVGSGWATGKIAAQLTGVHGARPGSEVLVFADGDGRPSVAWLAAMVAPLADARVGAVTGYRWYHAAGAPTAWTALRDAWNASGLEAMTTPRLRFLWGGSMAVRRADFERSTVRDAWRRDVSEDVGLTRAIQALGFDLAFAPRAVVASPDDWDRAEVLAWVVRQTALTRVALPRLYRFAAGVYGASVALLVAGLLLAAAGPSPALHAAGLLMLAPMLAAPARAALRARMVRAALPTLANRPARERTLQLAASLAVPWLMLWALAKARRVEAIDWRGRRYRLPTPEA
jgi:hypothetical protein